MDKDDENKIKYWLRKENKIKKKKYHKQYYQRPEVKERVREYHKLYKRKYLKELKNRLKKQQRDREYSKKPKVIERRKQRIKEDKNINLKVNIRRQIRRIFCIYLKKRKVLSSNKYGINYNKIIESLQPIPEDIENYDLHHIKPLASFNFVNEDNSININSLREAFSPKNYKLITKKEHRKLNHFELMKKNNYL